MTGREMSKALGVSEATVSRLASGERKPSTDLMVKVKEVLGWSISQQALAVVDHSYAWKFKERMEKKKAPPTRAIAA